MARIPAPPTEIRAVPVDASRAALAVPIRPPASSAHSGPPVSSPPGPGKIQTSAIVAFADWLATRNPDPRKWSQQEINEGFALAKARRNALRALIPVDPHAAIRAALPPASRVRLPDLLLAEMEEWIAGRGRFDVLCPAASNPAGDPGSNSHHPGYFRTFTLGGRTFSAFVYGRRQSQMTTASADLHGIAIDDRLAVDENPLRVLSGWEATRALAEGRVPDPRRCAFTGQSLDAALPPTVVQVGDQLLAVSSPEAARALNERLASTEPGFRRATEPPSFQEWSHGIKRLLFMRARFPDDLREPVSEAEAADVMRLANEYFVAASFNSLSVISTIGPLVTLPQPKLFYSVVGAGRLLDDARDATRRAGVDPDAFELDMVRFESVPGFDWGGLGSVGGKGVWLQGTGVGIICHELGHNLGLGHGNFWNTVRPDLPEDTRNLPFDSDSVVGLDSIMGSGDDVEYGDPFDIMGGGGGPEAHYTALHKILLGWLPQGSAPRVTASGLYRVLAHDRGVLQADAVYALRIRKDADRDYWVSARSAFPDNPWLSNGVELHWNNWYQAIGTCELLDTTPGSRPGKDDAALVVGHTFTDPAAQVSITPVAKGQLSIAGRAVPYYDVYVAMGETGPNAAPTIDLQAGTTTAETGQAIRFTASASDPDGDSLAFGWDLGGGIPGPNQPTVTNAWTLPGDYVVRCEVSDRRGGVASRHVVVRVGRVASLRITGQVIDQSGLPLAEVRVHNGQVGTNGLYADDYRWAYTDSEGRYTLTGLQPGTYSVGAFLGGYAARPLNFTRPLILNQFTGVGVDFIATALPLVSISASRDGTESPSDPVVFQLARAGPTNEALRVYFRTAGSATEGDDYSPWPDTETQTNTIPTVLDPVLQAITFGFVDLPPGVLTTNLSFPVQPDAASEGDETLTVTLAYPVTRTVVTETETNVFDIPGWEVQADNGQDTWFQTRPRYQLGVRDEAVAHIHDAAPPGPTTISITALDPEVSENEGDAATFLVSRVGPAPAQDLRVPLTVAGSATAGEDYEPLPSEIVIPADADAVRLSLNVLDDRFIEGNETVVLTLGTGAGYHLGSRSAQVAVVDNDLPLVSVTAVDPVLDETSSGGRVTFQRSGDLSQALDVDYLVAGSATAAADYQGLPGRITIPPGASSATLQILPVNDNLLEGDETIEIQVGDSPVYNSTTPARATVILRDDEFPTVTVDASVPQTTEGADPGVFLIRRTGSVALPLTVHYQLGGSAIHQADYVASGDRVDIPAGRSAVAITVTPIDDAIREDTETIAIELVPDADYSLGTPARAAIDLLDNGDSDLAVGFALLSSSGPESRTDPQLAVRISGNPDEGDENAVTVDWEVLGGTARNGEDFVLEQGTLLFSYADPEGDQPLSNRVAFIPLQIVDDALVESDETIVVRLRIAPTLLPSDDAEAPPNLVTNGVLDVYSVHTYTILDDDHAIVSVVATVPNTVEGSDLPARFSISRAGPTNAPLPVTFFLSGLASAGSDYLDVSNQVIIPAGSRVAEVPIRAIEDPVSEYRENVILTLVDAPGAQVGNPSRAEVSIDDNDGTLEFAAARWEVHEGDGIARILVRRTGPAILPATAVFRTFAGTAREAFLTNGMIQGDFIPTNGIVTFSPGDDLKEFDVQILQDDEVEGPETLQIQLSRGSDLFPLGGQNLATLTILDDDAFLSTGTNAAAGLESDTELTVTLERSGRIDGPAHLTFVTEDSTAIAGQDFVATSGTVDFTAGQRTATLTIPLIDDFVIEGDETLLLRFTNDSGAPVGEIPAFIVDDDCAITFTSATAEVDEDAGVVELPVLRIGSPVRPVEVAFTTRPGTAQSETDFETTSGTLPFLGNRFETLTNGTGEMVFRLGETNGVLTIPILNDGDGERDETFTVSFTGLRSGGFPVGAPFVTFGAVTNAVVTIRDNETPGRVDDRFQPGLGADASVRALAVQPDGKILVGGDFTTLDGVILPRLGRLHADGFLDQSFNPGRGFDGSVLAVVTIADGRILVGGTFTNVDAAPQPFLARLEPDGTRSAGFSIEVNGPVHAIAVGQEVFVGGDFTAFGGISMSGVGKLAPDGGLDPTFSAGSDARPGVRALAALDAGLVLVGGEFQGWGRSNGRFLVRLLAEGSLDPAFTAARAPNGPVSALLRLPDNSVLVAGQFTALGGIPSAGLARVLPSGAVDGSFKPGDAANAPILALGNQSAKRVVVAGAFDGFQDMPAGRFLRLETDGTIDTTFFRGTGANDVVRALAVQPDGAFVIGGDFTTVNDHPRLRIARIHADEEFAEGFVEFAAPVFSGVESQPGITVRVRRTGTAKARASVQYLLSGGTASAGADYVPAGGELVFDPGVTNAEFTISLKDDLMAEGSETIGLSLTNAQGARIGHQADATAVIEDDEPAIAFDLASAAIAEDAGDLVLVVRRSGRLQNAASVGFITEAISATEGEDFESSAGTAEFPSGVATHAIHIPILDDTRVEGPEILVVRLGGPSSGIALGTQSAVTVTILDDDQLPTTYLLTVQPAAGGVVVPGGGRYPTNAVMDLLAIPDPGFEFERWEGTVSSADNPLPLLMDRNQVLTARFLPRSYLDSFESGNFSALPWQTAGDVPWVVTNETAATGRYSARSGSVRDRGTSILALDFDTGAGTGTFDFRTASERGWDFLEFHLNGARIERWSGLQGWQTYTFSVPAGRNHFEWVFTRDPTFGGAEDAAWIDNLDLPDPTATSPRLLLLPGPGGWRVRVDDAIDRLHTLESSSDLRTWSTVIGGLPGGTELPLQGSGGGQGRVRFYRLKAE